VPADAPLPDGQAASGSGYGSSYGQRQNGYVVNTTRQRAYANVHNLQLNLFKPVSVGGTSGGGSVTQSNAASNNAAAAILQLSFGIGRVGPIPNDRTVVSESNQTALVGPGRQLVAVGQLQLAQDGRHVGLHRLHREREA
jgi:hypothetical protein